MKHAKFLILLLLPSIAFAEIYQERRKIDLSARGIDMLVVTCGAGSLIVRGVDGLERLGVTAVIEIEVDEDKDLHRTVDDHLRLTLEKRKNQALLTSDIVLPEKLESRINLKVEMPKGMHLKIVDGSGTIKVLDLSGNLEIDDDSGSIEVENVVGRVTVDDSSGSIAINTVTGNVVVRDGSGFIDISDINGDVFIVDGSGDILILHILGNVTVTDGSGDIDISDVGSNLSIREAGSGELSIERITGKVTIPEELVESD